MKPEELIQRSPEWYAFRAGKVTASRVSEVIARNKPRKGQEVGEYTAKRSAYMKQLVSERLTGTSKDNGDGPYSLRARVEMEPEAIAAYEMESVCDVVSVGFVCHSKIELAGCSPDGLVGDEGLTEIKCLDSAQHAELIETGDIDAGYLAQIQFQLACTGRQWCDFTSYDPRMPGDLRLWIRRIPRNDMIIRQMEAEVSAFIAEVDAKVAQILGGA